MPKIPTDYSKTIIYKLVHKNDNENKNIYIGSTTDFIKRKCGHKNFCNNVKSKGYNNKKYKFIRENGGWNEWVMTEIEVINCNDGNEARVREQYWICHFNANLNDMKAYMTEQDKQNYYQNRQDAILKQKKEYYLSNRDKILKSKKEYYNNNKSIISERSKKRYLSKKNVNIIQGQQQVQVQDDRSVQQVLPNLL
jgi:predicted GIY-YIG superfamily endonuclease